MATNPKDELVTRGMLDQAVEAILKGMDNLARSLRSEFKGLLKEEIEPVKTDTTFIKRDIRDIKAELSDTPSRREFNELKSEIGKIHPLA